MNIQRLARLLYRLLLRLHPAGFRRRFGEEMLWIFDVSSCDGETAYMLLDGVRSICIQHAELDLQEAPATQFCLEVRTSGLTVARVCQATVLSAALLLAMASVIAREMPPISVFNEKPSCQQFVQPQPQPTLEIPR
jgi:hypothetical protein